MTLGPERFAFEPRVDSRRRRLFYRFEVEYQPCVRGYLVRLGRILENDVFFFAENKTYKVLLMPAGKDNQFRGVVMETGPHYGGIPFPAVIPNHGGIGLHGVFVKVVEYEDIHIVAGKRAFTPYGDQLSFMALHLDVGSSPDAVRFGRERPDGGPGEKFAVRLGIHYALGPFIEPGGERSVIGGYGYLQIRVASQHINRE